MPVVRQTDRSSNGQVSDSQNVDRPVPQLSSSRGTASGSGCVVFQEEINRIAARSSSVLFASLSLSTEDLP